MTSWLPEGETHKVTRSKSAELRGINRRLTVLIVLVALIAIIDGAYNRGYHK